MYAGVIESPAGKNPALPKLSPGKYPKADAVCGIRTDPCSAIQYPY
jgi:hypothetical protein